VHLAAFGASGALPVPYQAVSNPAQGVNSFPHIHNVINNNNYANRSEPSGGSLLSSMSAGLAPALPGQLGPTIEQLLERRAREWKPYHNAAEFKEALQDWFTGVLRTYPGDLDRHRAAHEYVTETLSIMEKIGWQKAYEYHKAAFKAGAKIPPLYDPLRHGPIYQFGYITLVHPHLTQPRRFYNKSDSSTGSRTGPQGNSASKRPRSGTQCSLHPTSNHTNAECKAQQANKRQASSGGGARSTAAPATAESDA
jgi:hypothetical protein